MREKRNSIAMRIDIDLAEWVKDIAKANNLSDPQASKELAKLRKKLNDENKKIIKEIRF